MRTTVFLIFTWFTTLPVASQNLVANPSFEDVVDVNCSWTDAQNTIGSYLTGWESPNQGSPDMHSLLVSDSCWSYASGSTYNDTITCQPGGQMPRTGNVMDGLITLRDSSEWREYLQNTLLELMITGKLYNVKFHVSLADNSGYSTNNLAVYFSTEGQNTNQSGVIQQSPQIEFKSIIGDDQNWVELDTVILASNQWKYLTIGNFRSSEDTESKAHEYCPWSYYYKDDVSVTLSESQTTIPEVFTPNRDGVNDSFRPILLEPREVRGIIFDRWGRKMYEPSELQFEWDGTNSGGFEVPDGVYFWVISYSDINYSSYQLNGSVTLLR